MKFHLQQAIRAFILLAFAVMLCKFHFSGDITKFINPKYENLSQAASILFFILFIIQNTRIWTIEKNIPHHHCHHDNHTHHCHHDHGNSPFNKKKLISYLVIVLPLVTGFLLPAKVLDASIADKKGGLTVLTNQKQTTSETTKVQEETTHENPIVHSSVSEPKIILQNEYDQLIKQFEQSSTVIMNDEVFSTYYDEIQMNLNKYKGKDIEIKGFVYKEEGLEQDQLVIARFLITHCVADAGIIGFISELPEASTLEVNTWINAQGVLDTTTYNGNEIPIIKITNWEEIKEPKEPYLYPIHIKII